MSFVISPEKFQNSVKEGDIYIKGDYYKNKNGFAVKQGEIFNYNDKELFNKIHTKGTSLILRLKGEFLLVWYDKKLKRIYIGNDKLGREILFYFYDKKRFILSNDFWEIVNIIEPNKFDIDVQSVKEFLIFNRPLFFKTIIKNLNFFPPASIGNFSIKDRAFNIDNYWDFKYTPEDNLSLDEAIERLDLLLTNSLKRIKEQHNPNAIYGFGLSGGMDSRLIPHYAKKHNMKLKSFIIGERKPHKLFLSRDHASARKIAKFYKLRLYDIPYNSISFYEKAYSGLKFVPMVNSRLFDTVGESKFPKFGVLLTGMNGGEIFGNLMPPNIQTLNKKQLVDKIISSFSLAYEQQNIFKRTLFKGELNKRINPLIDKKAYIKARQKIEKFVETEIRKDKTNVDIFQKYVFFLIQNNKYGAFGMFFKKGNYSIFSDTHIIEESLRWKPTFLINRKLQTQFFLKKFPELAKIPSQDFQPAIFYRDKKSIFRKVLAIIEFILRGAGVVRYSKWSREKLYLDFAKKVLSKHNNIFENIFDIKHIQTLKNIPSNLVKIKLLLDIIENKSYNLLLKENYLIKKYN